MKKEEKEIKKITLIMMMIGRTICDGVDDEKLIFSSFIMKMTLFRLPKNCIKKFLLSEK